MRQLFSSAVTHTLKGRSPVVGVWADEGAGDGVESLVASDTSSAVCGALVCCGVAVESRVGGMLAASLTFWQWP